MKQKIQKSMMLILLVTLFPFYVIMTVILYNQNLGILEKEVQQEAAYLSSGVDVAGEEYLKKLEPMIKADEDTRLTFISQSGDVLYDSDSSKKLENHKSRAEVKQALAEGQGEDIRMSDTVGKELYYCAIRLDDGSVLRLARPMDSLIRTAWNILPVMLVLSVIGIALALFLANWQTKRLMEPVMHLDLEHPLDNVIYPEMVPLLEAIDRQNKEKEAVANMRKEFSANVSHELKTPLTSISGYAEIMMNGLVRAEDIPGFSKRIYKEARRLITLVEDIIKLSKLDEESVVIYPEMVPLLEAIDRQNKEKEAVANMRKEFSANVSHELKTPLTSISGYAEIMMNGLVRAEDIPGFSKRIYKEARRLITLVEDIIKLSKLDEESVELEKEDVELYELTREIVSRLSPQCSEKKISVALSGEPVFCHGIRQILDEMIYNITENAIKYNRDGGSVSVWVGNTLDGPKISVSDTGIGIPEEHQERIFERFYRVDKSHSKERGGTGLGLSIVKHGAILHGAKVTVSSEPGKGTKIEIRFPKEKKMKKAEVL